MNYQKIEQALRTSLRFRAKLIGVYPKGVKSMEQAEAEGVEPTKPWQVRFEDGASWPPLTWVYRQHEPHHTKISSKLFIAPPVTKIRGALMDAINPFVEATKAQFQYAMNQDLGDVEVVEWAFQASLLEGLDEDPVVVSQIDADPIVGLNPAWVMLFPNKDEAERCEQALTDALAPFRRQFAEQTRIFVKTLSSGAQEGQPPEVEYHTTHEAAEGTPRLRHRKRV